MNTIVSAYPEILPVVEFCLNELHIDGIHLTIARSDKLLDRLAPPDIDLMAITTATNTQGCYCQYYRGVNPSKIVVCHEMAHLSQMVSGRLRNDLKTGVAVWDGVEYDNAVPYFSREWEEEAFNKERKLLKAYNKSKK